MAKTVVINLAMMMHGGWKSDGVLNIYIYISSWDILSTNVRGHYNLDPFDWDEIHRTR